VPPPKTSLRGVAAAAGDLAVLDNLAIEVVLAFNYAADEGAGKIVCGLPRILLPRTRVDTFRILLDARLEELKGLLEG
jgi:hypothetical protein